MELKARMPKLEQQADTGGAFWFLHVSYTTFLPTLKGLRLHIQMRET